MWIVALAGTASAQVIVSSTGLNYPTITQAIAAATAGDTLEISPGTYAEALVVDRDLTLAGPGATVDGTGCSEAVIAADAGVTLTLDGLRLESSACRGVDLPAANTLIASNLQLATATTGEGGGIRALDPVALTLSQVVFEATTADLDGGGLYVDATGQPPVALTDVTFRDAAANGPMGVGGGVRVAGVHLQCTRCAFEGGSAFFGGGIFDVGDSVLTIVDSSFVGTYASGSAAALAFDQSLSVEVVRTTFCDNDTQVSGGAIAGSALDAPVTIRNSWFVDNDAADGGAIYAFEGDWTLQNVTVAGSGGSAAIEVTYDATMDLVNTAIVDSDGLGLTVTPGGTASGDYLLASGNAGGDFSGASVMYTPAEPGFVAWSDDGDCTNDLLHPTFDSAMFDGGDPALLDPDGSVSDIGYTGGPEADPALWVDGDGDGVAVLFDCDDLDDTAFPDADETCDGADDDCDGETDELAIDAPEWFPDCDGDGQGPLMRGLQSCDVPTTPNPCVVWVTETGDCDDADVTVYTGAPELCGGGDQDCDGDPDAGAIDASTWYADGDGDGFGDLTVQACTQPVGTAATGGDCDDGESAVFPGAVDLCGDALDQDCDGLDGEAADRADWVPDADSDGFGDRDAAPESDCVDRSTSGWVDASLATDCDDATDLVNPAATETCNGVDDDCDDAIDDAGPVVTWYPDADGDGYGDPAGAIEQSCEPGSDWLTTAGDCDDTRVDVSPDGLESCNGVDDDCDGRVDAQDEGAIGLVDAWPDQDGDGFGGCPDEACAATPVCLSELGAGWDDGSSDCDDADPSVHPGADEVVGNAVDEDCDGQPARAPDEAGGCGCASAGGPGWIAAAAALGVLVARRRRLLGGESAAGAAP